MVLVKIKLKRRFLENSLRVFLLCSLLIVAKGSVNVLAQGQNRKRPVSVVDCIQMSKLGAPEYWRGGFPEGGIAQFSPDMRKFVVLLRKGNLEENTNEYSLNLWQTDDVFNSAGPVVLLTMSSSSNREAITDVTWLDDNETVAFLGEQPGEQRQLYTFNVRTQALKKLTNHPTSLTSYNMTPRGDQIAYVAEEPAESMWNKKTRREGFPISNEVLSNLVAGQKRDAHGYNGERKLFFQSHSKVSGPLDAKGRIELLHSIPSLSLDGKRILIPTQLAKVPDQWKEYSDPELHDLTTQKLLPGQYSFLTRFVLIDATTGESQVLLESPVGRRGAEVAWAPDGRSVAIAGIYLPLEGTSGEERRIRRSKTFVVEVRVPDGEITKISEQDLRLLRWESKGLVLKARTVKAELNLSPKVLFRRSGEGWEKVGDKMETEAGPEIIVEENMNTRPKIFALHAVTRQKNLLLDLNPQFDDLRFAKVEQIEWGSPGGHKVKGGLYYPLDFAPGKRYPLVIQTHGWNRNKFWIDGPWTSAFAAQPLAGKNIFVLQVPDPPEDLEKTPEEATSAVSAFEGAIEYLDTKRLIDRSRVGLIGFSRTGLYVRYALTHSDQPFAAVSVMDSNDGGYFQYLALSNSNPDFTDYNEGINGAAPFGAGLKKWMEHSPGFSINKVRIPFRIVSPRSSISVLSEWEWFAALTRLGKVVEMVMLEDGDHILQKPWDRMVSQQGNVDWFAFWLKGEEDPDPTKVEQYARWHELRKMQEENDTKAKAAKEKPAAPN